LFLFLFFFLTSMAVAFPVMVNTGAALEDAGV
jgi:hypothetical protein